jgi:hypothetical protein
MKKTVLGAKALAFSVVFFFMGMASSMAQYVSPSEAMIILKGEINSLEAQIPGATNQELVTLYWKIYYFSFIRLDISEGTEVGVAIQVNKPTTKPKLHPGGHVTMHDTAPNVKQEIMALVAYIDNLLSD